MKIIKKITSFLIYFVTIPLIQAHFLSNYYIKSDMLDRIITFLSIIFGFYITSLAIFATSKYVSTLYKTVDKENPNITLLHTLLKNYKDGLKLIFFSILYLLIVQFVVNQTENDEMLFSNLWLLPFLSVIIVNFWYSYKMLRDLIRIILQEAKNNYNHISDR
jgi:hypothetical protein